MLAGIVICALIVTGAQVQRARAAVPPERTTAVLRSEGKTSKVPRVKAYAIASTEEDKGRFTEALQPLFGTVSFKEPLHYTNDSAISELVHGGSVDKEFSSAYARTIRPTLEDVLVDPLGAYYHRREEVSHELGCALSHRSIWQQFVETSTDNEWAAVFETDARFSNDFAERFAVLSEGLRRDGSIEMVFLGHCMEDCADAQRVLDLGSGSFARWSSYALCTHAYMISRRSAQKLLLETSPLRQAIDEHLSDAVTSRLVRSVSVCPPLVLQPWQADGYKPEVPFLSRLRTGTRDVVTFFLVAGTMLECCMLLLLAGIVLCALRWIINTCRRFSRKAQN